MIPARFGPARAEFGTAGFFWCVAAEPATSHYNYCLVSDKVKPSNGQPDSDPIPESPEASEDHTVVDALARPSSALSAMPRLVAKRYQIEGIIGAGGMGAVYRAFDVEKKRTVAIKRLSVGEQVGDTTISNPTPGRFRREFIVMQRLHHPNVVEVLDFGYLDSLEPYFVMELVQGMTLSTLLRQKAIQPNLPDAKSIEQSTKVWLQLCGALGFIHANGMVHRDVKPANIMLEIPVVLSETSEVSKDFGSLTLKLMDFGLARFADDSMDYTQAGSMMGTAAYISPEQAVGGTIDLRTDLYSLGVIMYEMATGRAPFTSDTPWGIVRQHIEANPLAPKFLNPALPDFINSIILNLLSKDAAQRFSSADEVAAALRARQMPDHVEATTQQINVRPTLFGRAEVITQLQDACGIAWGENRVQCVVVHGDIGLGKSALLTEMNTWAKRRNTTVLRGVCSETGRMPYGAVAEALSTYLGSRQRESLRDKLLRDIRFEIARIIPELASGSVQGRMAVAEDGNPAQSQARLFSAVSQLVARIAQRKPVLWVIDDAQWLGADALELLAYILRRNTEAPVCVLLTERPEPPLNIEAIENAINRNNVQLIGLKALDATSARMLAEVSLSKQASPNAVDFVVQRADGNPLFIQELANMLKAERPTKEAIASVNDTLSLPVPVRIARVMANRLAELHDVQRRMLEWAAVFGREFNLDLLASAVEQSADDVADVVDVLLKRQVLQEGRTARSETYRFAQQQLREVVYGELSARRKRTMHGSVANAMERVGSAAPADLEFHFGEAGDDGKAIRYGLQSGDRAREAYANQDALRFYQRVLDRAGTKFEFRDQAAHAYLGLGETHIFLANYPLARAELERVLELTA